MKTTWLQLLLLLATPAGGLCAQDLEIATVEGRRITGVIAGLSGEGSDAVLAVETAAGEESLPLAGVLGIHGAGPRPVPAAVVHLVGGDELRGVIRAGDPGGETLVVESPSLGPLTVFVDRLREIALRPGIRAEDLRVPEGDEEEAVFLPTPGARLDSVVGVLHRFTDGGLVFEESGREPREMPYDEVVGFALAGGQPREDRGSLRLVTRSGDAVGADLLAISGGRFRFALEGGHTVELQASDIAALAFGGDDRRFLAELTPVAVEESWSFGDDNLPLYPYRVDRTVTGNYLVAGGRAHATGLGVHSRSRLTYTVPEGFTRFHALVAVDDEVEALGLRADVDVRVLLGGEELARIDGLSGGRPAHDLGVLEVTAGEPLVLEVDFGKGLGLADRVDWLSPVFLR